MKTISVGRIRAARALAVCTDLIQVGFPYVFGPGFLSPFDAALDVAACLALTALVGWHNAFIPAFLIEVLPIGDLAPTWTIAAFIATRGSQTYSPETPHPRVTPRDHKGRPLEIAIAGEQDSASSITAPLPPAGSYRTEFWDRQKEHNKY
ncbi:MAG: hypothetical protein WCT12_25280 [Verrucomicrobiota bacterium]